MRNRWSVVGTASSAASYASSTMRLARSPMAWTYTWKPARRAATATVRIESCPVVTSAAVPGLVAVVLEQRRAARSQRAVGVQLDRAEPQAPAVQGALRSPPQVAGEGGAGVARHHHVVPEPELARPRQLLVHVDGRRPRRPASCRPVSPHRLASATAARMAARVSSAVSGGTTRSIRSMASSTKTPVGEPSAFADDPAPGRIGRGGRHAGQRERPRVDQDGVPVHPREPHRIVRHGAAQGLLGREARADPVVLVPPATPDPLAGPGLARPGRHPPDDLLVAAGTDEIHPCAGFRRARADGRAHRRCPE